MRGLVRLPPRVPCPVLGPPIIVDGQQLNHVAQLALKLRELFGSDSIGTMSVPDARARTRSDAGAYDGPKIPLRRVQEVAVTEALRARLYVPPDVGEPSPLLVFFHGGGFVFGDLETHDNGCRFLARQAGVRVLAIHYRRAPEPARAPA